MRVTEEHYGKAVRGKNFHALLYYAKVFFDRDLRYVNYCIYMEESDSVKY